MVGVHLTTLEWIAAHGPATVAEVAAGLGVPHATACGRVRELWRCCSLDRWGLGVRHYPYRYGVAFGGPGPDPDGPPSGWRPDHPHASPGGRMAPPSRLPDGRPALGRRPVPATPEQIARRPGPGEVCPRGTPRR